MTGLTLTRSQRIRKRADFVRIQDGGARVSTRHFLLLLSPQLAARADVPEVHPSTAPNPARLGVVASRKVGGAVERNRAKRLLREVFRKHQEIFPPQLDVVIIVRPGAHELAFADVEAEITAVGPLLQKRASSLFREGAGIPPPRPGRAPRPARTTRATRPEKGGPGERG
ncbi:MAG: ribonuclease P protein component [Polyangiaceae bacterium]|nr:ribonuclease P protein component [Polyangiaceae bacterium]